MFYEHPDTYERFVAAVYHEKDYPHYHWNDNVEVIYCFEGSTEVMLNKTLFALCAGQAIFIEIGEPHKNINASPDSKILVIHIGEDLLGKDFSHIINIAFNQSEIVEVSGEIKTIFDKIIAHSDQPAAGGAMIPGAIDGELIVKGCLFELCAFIIRTFPCLPDISGQKIKKIRTLRTINKILEYLLENYQKQITVEEVARITGYTKRNFLRQFKGATQMTFHKYLNETRIQKACELLGTSDKSIALVAEETGFPVAKTFCRVFKEFMKMTPTQYREM
ncbi:MAG: AraC family transcriptional regulator [Oscillospiraceae bacterium]|nr:AraC family transcriptional regulator [Oscillospiraceae bacterium]